MRGKLRINVTNWEDQLFWTTQPAAVPSCYYSCFFSWCLLKCKQPPHIQNFMLSYISNYGKVMHLFLTSGSENHVFPLRIVQFLHILCANKLAFFIYDLSDILNILLNWNILVTILKLLRMAVYHSSICQTIFYLFFHIDFSVKIKFDTHVKK